MSFHYDKLVRKVSPAFENDLFGDYSTCPVVTNIKIISKNTKFYGVL